MDVNYCRLKVIKFKDPNGNHMHGFLLIGKNHTHEFYASSEEEAKDWIRCLKRYVTLLDLKEQICIQNILGKGNSSKVHQCYRKSDPKQLFALKTINKTHIMQSNHSKTSLLKEIEIMRIMSRKTPNVIELHEVYESSKYLHLLLPLLEGGELFKQIKKHGLYQESDAISIMQNFLSALASLHDNLVVHRDLKPENLILAQKNGKKQLYVCDFGLATRITDPK